MTAQGQRPGRAFGRLASLLWLSLVESEASRDSFGDLRWGVLLDVCEAWGSSITTQSENAERARGSSVLAGTPQSFIPQIINAGLSPSRSGTMCSSAAKSGLAARSCRGNAAAPARS
jgi:hypothetical protein